MSVPSGLFLFTACELAPLLCWEAAPLEISFFHTLPCLVGSPCSPSSKCFSLHTASLQTSLHGHLLLPLHGHLPNIWCFLLWLIPLLPVHSCSLSRLFPLSLSVLIVLWVPVPRPFYVPKYARAGWDNSVWVNTPVRIHVGLVHSS